MLYLIVLILLTLFFYIWLQRMLSGDYNRLRGNYDELRHQYENLAQYNLKSKMDNSILEKSVNETIALYDITQDICKSLDEDKVFAFFKERIDKYIAVGDCRFLKAASDVMPFKGDTVLPLMIQDKSIGYLAASKVKEQDEEKFHIMGQQFLLGIKRANLYKEVSELSITDSLTEIFSRRYFLERLDEEIQRAKNNKLKFSFLMADIDHFKDYNDHYGHLVGDVILKEVAMSIKESIRQIDFMGRYGGEELSVVLTETDKERGKTAAERIRKAIESLKIRAYDEDLKVTISIGIAAFPDDAGGVRALIERSDEALYRAKQSGRNKVCF